MTYFEIIKLDRFLLKLIKWTLAGIIISSIVFGGFVIYGKFSGNEMTLKWDTIAYMYTIFFGVTILFILKRVQKIKKLLKFGVNQNAIIKRIEYMAKNSEQWEILELVSVNILDPNDMIRLTITIPYEDRTLNLRDKFDAGYLAEYVTLKVGQEISVIYEEDLPAEYLLRKLWNTN